MKKLLIFSLVFISLAANVMAQDEEKEGIKLFQKDKLFTGGSISLGFSSDMASIGANPVFGQSFNKYLDVGMSFNFAYSNYRYAENAKQRSVILGPGAFVRAYPVNFLFVHAQYEINFIKYKDMIEGAAVNYAESYQINTILLGAGYCSGREDEDTPYYYFGVFFDVLGDKYEAYPGDYRYSPYVGSYGQIIPFFKAGVQIPLFRGGR